MVVALACSALAPMDALADARSEARRHFQRGMSLIEEGQVAEGIDELRIAHAILPHPNVLYNIGRASLEIGRYDDAIEAWERYLATGPDDEDAVRELIASVRRQRDASAGAEEPSDESADDPSSPVSTPAAAASAPAAIDREHVDEVITLTEESARILRRFRSPSIRRRAERLDVLAGELRDEVAEAEERAAFEAARQRALADAAGEPAGSPRARADMPPDSEDGDEGSGDGALELLEDPVYDERVVSASRTSESPLVAPNSTTSVTAQDIRLSGLVGLVPLGELLRRAAGVDVMTLGPGATDVSIRGLNQRRSNKVLVLVDGRPINLDFIGAPDWGLVPVVAEDIERIEVIRGPASAVYGADAFSGVINILTRRQQTGGAFASASAGQGDSYRAAGSLSAREGSVSLHAGGGYARRDQWAVEVGKDREDLSPTADDEALAIQRATLDLDVEVDLGEGAELSVGNGLVAMDNSFYSVSRFRQSSGRNVMLNQAHAALTTDAGVSLRSFWSFFGIDVALTQSAPGSVPSDTRIDSHVFDVSLDWTGRVDFGVPQDVSLGTGYRFKTVRWDWAGGRQTQHHFNLYAQDVLRLHERFRLHLSARLDRHPLLDRLQFSPRAAAIALPTESSSVRFVVARAFRSPTFLESYLELLNGTDLRGVTALGRGNVDLDPERITSFELGYLNQDADWMSFEVNVYVNFVDDLIQLASLETFGLEDFGSGRVGYAPGVEAFPVGELRFANEGARLRQVGGEMGFRLNPIDGVDISASYAVHDTSPVGEDAGESFLAEDQRTPRHKVNLGFQYRAPFGLDAAFDVHWVDDQTWSEQVTDAETGVRFVAFDIPAYTLVNAYLGWRFLGDHLELGLSVYDLLDQRRRQHPFGQPVARRFMGRVTGHF